MNRNLADITRLLINPPCQKQNEFASTINVSRSALSQFVRGKSSISEEKLLKLATILGVNKAWVDGEDEIFLKSGNIL